MNNAMNPGATYIYRPFMSKTYEANGTWTGAECKWLNKIANAVIKAGAISKERLAKLTKLDSRTIEWGLMHLEAKCGTAELYYLTEFED